MIPYYGLHKAQGRISPQNILWKRKWENRRNHLWKGVSEGKRNEKYLMLIQVLAVGLGLKVDRARNDERKVWTSL